MAPDENRVLLTMDAREENVALARSVAAQVASALDFTLPELEELRVAVSEAVSNAVLHAYARDQGAIGPVDMELVVAGGGLAITVRDRGCGIADVAAAREAEFTTLEGHLGLGFAFMEAMSDELRVESEPGRGTMVHMLKRPSARTPADAPAT